MSDSGCRTAKVHLIEDKHYKISRLGPAVGDAGKRNAKAIGEELIVAAVGPTKGFSVKRKSRSFQQNCLRLYK